MGVYSWYNEHELKQFSTVEDPEINKLLQEVREKTDNRFFIQELPVYLKTGNIFNRKEKKIERYQLMLLVNPGECQIINFYVSPEWSINTTVEKPLIMAYLYGLLCGTSFEKYLKESAHLFKK